MRYSWKPGLWTKVYTLETDDEGVSLSHGDRRKRLSFVALTDIGWTKVSTFGRRSTILHLKERNGTEISVGEFGGSRQIIGGSLEQIAAEIMRRIAAVKPDAKVLLGYSSQTRAKVAWQLAAALIFAISLQFLRPGTDIVIMLPVIMFAVGIGIWVFLRQSGGLNPKTILASQLAKELSASS